MTRGGGFIFLDGNWKNRSPENLFYVTTEELRLFYRQKEKKWSAEYTKAVILRNRLRKKINEREIGAQS
ncbi:hypothetical protein NG891_14480 [Enterococcus gallinarum]|uniref:hypothetical protein n=1 Tax=Enterococcus gallinarum TaxID=1353 RepID=UPI002090BD24|nr:hypothetical protein [Enterococcus gallinarum]MCO5477952.1 hypothetical protein [Enterococcus gallinarum]